MTNCGNGKYQMLGFTQEGRLLGSGDSEAGRGQPDERKNRPKVPLSQNAWLTP